MTITTEQKVGLFFLFSLITLGVIIELVEDWDPFRKQFAYHTHFSSSVGLKVGDPVRMAGVEVGKIEKIGIDGLQVRVDFLVDETTEIRTDSIARIRQLNLLGGQFLGLGFGSLSESIIPPGAKIMSAEGTNIDQLVTNLNKNQEELFGKIDSIVTKIDKGEGLVGMLLTDTELSQDIKNAVDSMTSLMSKLSASDAANDLAETLDNLNVITASLRKGEGTLGKLVTEEDLYVNVNNAFADLSSVAKKIKDGEGLFGKMLTDDQAYDDLQKTLTNLRNITDKIESGQGTIGKLINDPDLYHDAKTTINKIEKAADGLNDSGAVSALGTVAGTLF